MTIQISGSWPPTGGKKQAVVLNLVALHQSLQKPPKTPGSGDEESRIIIGGNDGILITIDANGQIHVLHSEGPGDPEVRKAVASIVESILVLTRLADAADKNT
jgi:hypothetical protein